MNPPGKRDDGSDPTHTITKPVELPEQHDPNRILWARSEAAAAPTVNVVPDPSLHNDPARARHDPSAAATVNATPHASVPMLAPPHLSDPTVNVSPDPGMHNDPARARHPIPHQTIPHLSDPTVNVSPEPGLHNDPARARHAIPHQTIPHLSDPTVNVSPEPGMHNDPARARHAIPQATVPMRPPAYPPDPTVSVSPEPGVHNDPNRILVARAEAASAPTVNVVPDPALHNDPSRARPALADLDEGPTMAEMPALEAPPPRATWQRPEDAPAPTLNVVPDGGLINDPQRTAYVRNDADTTHRLVEKPNLLTDADSTHRQLEKPNLFTDPGSTVRTDPGNDAPTVNVTPDHASAHTDPDPTQNVAPSDATTRLEPPRLSPPKPALLDGVAPLVPIQHFPADAALANFKPEAAPALTQKSQPPVEAWRESPEVKNWAPDERDVTRVMPAAAAPREGLRPPSIRDVLVLMVGFALLVAGMIIARRESTDAAGPLPAEKIQPPPGYEAPKHASTTAPYVAPETQASAAGTYAMAGSSSAAPAPPPPRAVAPPPPIRVPVPRCRINVPTALETKVSWEMDGGKKLLRLRVSPKRVAIQSANLFVANAQLAEGAELVRTENAAVWFDVFLDPPANGPNVVKVVLDCECGIALAEVQAVIDRKELKADLKYAKIAPPEVIAAKARKQR